MTSSFNVIPTQCSTKNINYSEEAFWLLCQPVMQHYFTSSSDLKWRPHTVFFKDKMCENHWMPNLVNMVDGDNTSKFKSLNLFHSMMGCMRSGTVMLQTDTSRQEFNEFSSNCWLKLILKYTTSSWSQQTVTPSQWMFERGVSLVKVNSDDTILK